MPLRLCVFVKAGLLALLSPLQARPLYIVDWRYTTIPAPKLQSREARERGGGGL